MSLKSIFGGAAMPTEADRPELERLVGRLYAREIDHFGYRF